MKNSPMKFEEPGIASSAIVAIRKKAASTGARSASPPIRLMSTVSALSTSNTEIRKRGTTTSPWLTICRTAPFAPSGRRLKMPRVMIPSCATDE